MALTKNEVEYIANLARLQLTPEEISRFSEQLSDILDYVARLQELDTAGIPAGSISPAEGSAAAPGGLRADEARPALGRDDLLANAAQVEKEQFRVPAVFE